MGPSEPHRLIYASPNGDHWYLLFDPTTATRVTTNQINNLAVTRLVPRA
jgi:hypothetical protein